MRSVGKTTCLFCLFILISLFFTRTLSGEEPPSPPPGKSLLFLEELFIPENIFSFYEALMDDDPDPGEDVLLAETPHMEEASPSEDSFLGETALLNEEIFHAEESSPEVKIPLAEEAPPAAIALIDDGASPDEEAFTSEEILPDEGVLLAEEDNFDVDAFFFEAVPLIYETPVFEIRSLNEIFPTLSRIDRATVMNEYGLRRSFVKNESPEIIPNPDLEIDLYSIILQKNPSHIIEALVVVPYKERELDLLDIYNALGRIERIKDQSITYRGGEIYLFTESTRIESARNRKAISDPSPSVTLPFSETMYIRLKEMFLGNLFLRGDLSISIYGITYSMTNFIDVRYLLIPLMKAERFITILYIEPVKEGILIYSMAGFYLPGFIADRITLTPNINRRINIFVNWITEGLRKQETMPQSR